MSQSTTPWKCDVFIRFIQDENGNTVHQVKEVPFGEPITDPKEVQERISQAQRAALNPSKDPKIFLSQTDSEDNERSFSENIIVLKLYGPDLVNLSFVGA